MRSLRTSTLVIVAVTAAFACGDKGEAADAAAAAGDPAAASGAVAAGAAVDYAGLARADDPGSEESWVLKPKMTVGEIVKSRYGDRHYTRPVLLHNGIKDASRLPVGKSIKTPSFDSMLLEEPGLRRRAGDEMSALVDARRAFMGLEAELSAQTKDAADPMQVTVSPELGAKLRALAGEFERLGEALAQDRPETRKPPTKMVGSLLDASAILERVADGEVLDEKFSVGLIHQRIGNAMADALIWARVERR